MKIVVVTQYYPPEPVPMAHAIAHELSARGHDVVVITGFPNYPSGRLADGYRQRVRHVEQDAQVRVWRVPIFISHSNNALGRILNYLSFGLSSMAAWRRVRGADVVYVYATQMTAAIGPARWRRRHGVPFVMHVQDLWPESITGSSLVAGNGARGFIAAVLRPWLNRLYADSAATIGTSSGMSKILIARGVAEERSHTVLNWAPDVLPVKGRRKAANPRPKCVLMFAGNLGDLQDLETVVRAAGMVTDLDDFHIRIVGSGMAEDRIRKLAVEVDATNVVFYPRVPYSGMLEHYAASHFQLVTLKNLEIYRATMPSKLQSSFAHGIPVITTVAGDVADLVTEEKVGLVSPPGDAEALAATFRAAYELPNEYRAEMGRRARALYESRMSRVGGIDKIEAILEAAVRSNPSPGINHSQQQASRSSPGW